MNEKNILLKVHKSYRLVVAICDKELYGKSFVENNKKIDLSGEFFNGEEMTEEEIKQNIIRYLKEDATLNIVGENSVNFAKELGIINDEGVTTIDGIPLALVLL